MFNVFNRLFECVIALPMTYIFEKDLSFIVLYC